jgi:zinc protease
VVLEEMRQNLGARRRMWDKHLPVLFHGSRYAERLTIGKREVLEQAPPDTLRRFYRDWYRPELMAVVAVGDFDPAQIEKLLRKRFAKLRAPAAPRERTVFPVPDHDETLISVALDPEATATELSVYCKLPKRSNETVADFRRGLIERLYHAMVQDRLNERRQEPAPPFLFASSASGGFVRSRDVYFQSVRVEDAGLQRGLDALLVEVERVDRHGFTATELERAMKELLRAREQLWRERDKRYSATLASLLEDHFLTGEPVLAPETSLELARRLLPTIELAEVNRLAQEWIGERSRVILVSAPEKAGPALPSEQALLESFAAVERLEIEPWIDRVRDEPLVAREPHPAEIVERRAIEALGVTEWRLANGIRVALKPTDFKNDEVLLAGFSPGGHSLVPDERHISAAYAGSLVQAGGAGAFDRVELDKALAGKVVQVSASIGELEEFVGGSASPEDLESMFQLVYLQLTAPRKDEEAVEAWFARQKGALENRLARPETVFADKFSETMSSGHPRRRPPSVEQLAEVDLDAALDVWRDRFADAGDFTFVIVGNIDLERIEPYVRSYLGGLPAGGRQESWKDLGIRAPEGVTRFEVRRGIEDKSQVRLTFTGDAAWSREEDHLLESLAQVVRIRLREVLREEMGATYGVGVSGGIRRRPREEYVFGVSFGCGPDKVTEMIEAVFAELRSVARDGVDASYVEKVREIQTREHETDLRENGFWRWQLLDHYRYGTDPRQILDHAALVQSVTPGSLKRTAERYLVEDRYVLGVLYPEDGQAQVTDPPAAAP